MKDNIININLETSTAPVIAESRGREWVEYGGVDGWKNLYPQFIIDLYYSSSISAAIINATSDMIAGEALVIEDEEDRDLEAKVKLQNFINRANSNESLHEVIKKVAFDFKLQGGFALNIVWAKDRSQGIAEVYHIDVSKLRCCKPDKLGRTLGYYISADWANTRMNKPYYVPAFNPNDRTSANQILYSGLYSPNMNSYYIPDYVSCNNWALIDGRVSEYHLNNISNGFAGSFMISFANGIPSAEERYQIEQSLTDKFCSETNSGKFVLTFSDDKTRTPEITPISTSDLDKSYLALQELLTSNILSGHRVTSKTLMGIDSANGFSSNTDELINAADFYRQTVIRPFQLQLLKQLGKIFQVNNMDLPVNFVQLKPITVQFDSKTIREVMTTDEIREELGLDALGDEETVEDEVALSKVEKTELESFIEEFGEDIPEDWEIVDEEIVDGEHEDFDFEEVLNEIANEKFDFASTGRANPNARDKQDGLNKKGTAFYKVRYMYDEKISGGQTRDFCRIMMRAKKIYRKKDIINMGSKPVNKGWGPKGAATYSIWFWKGGGNCQHAWKMIIYKAKSVKDADYVYYPDSVKQDKIIGAARARREGFKPPRNDKRVDRAPKTMKNNGFLEPR